jgi:hypothetical protein
MREDIKERWIDALISGEYRQGTGQLKDESGNYCCLGVLCDIVKEEVGGEWVKPVDFLDVTTFRVGESSDAAVLPTAVWQYVGFQHSNPDLRIGEKTPSLAALNDNGMSFEEIAAVIHDKF